MASCYGKCWHHLLHVDAISFFVINRCQKKKKIVMEKIFISSEQLENFNEMFMQEVTYDNIKSPKRLRFYLFCRRYILEKPHYKKILKMLIKTFLLHYKKILKMVIKIFLMLLIWSESSLCYELQYENFRDCENKTPNTNGLVKKTNCDTKITVIEKEILINIRSVEKMLRMGQLRRRKIKCQMLMTF